MSATTQSLRHSLRTLASSWPTDKLRPAIQFSAAIDKASDRIFYATPAGEGAGEGAVKGKEVELSPVQQRKAQQTAESLQRLLNNSASKAVSFISLSPFPHLLLLANPPAPPRSTP